MIELEDEADVPRPPAGQLPFRHLGDQLVADHDFALAGRVEPGDQVQQRGLARAAGPHQAEKLALRHVQGDAVEHVEPLAAAAEELVNAVNANNHAVFSKVSMNCLLRIAASLSRPQFDVVRERVC